MHNMHGQIMSEMFYSPENLILFFPLFFNNFMVNRNKDNAIVCYLKL